VAYRKCLRTGKVGVGELDLVVAATAFNVKILVLEAVWTVIMPAKNFVAGWRRGRHIFRNTLVD
jgi:hypothetical protein